LTSNGKNRTEKAGLIQACAQGDVGNDPKTGVLTRRQDRPMPSNTHAAHPRQSRQFLQSRRSAYQYVLTGAWSQAEETLAALSPDQRFGAQDWVTLATARHQLGRTEEATEAARRALALDPENHKAGHVLTMALMQQNRFAEALAVFEHFRSGPAREHYQFVVNHGTTLAQLTQPQEAAAVFLEAMVLEMTDPAIHMQLGLALKDMKLYQESAESFLTACTLDPDRFTAQIMVLHMRQHACDWQGFDEACAELVRSMVRIEQSGHSRGEGAVWALTAIPHPPALLKAAARQVALKCAKGVSPLPLNPMPAPGTRRIRVGYVSADFHNHATALLFVEALERRNSNAFEVTLYSHSPDDSSSIQHRIRAACERFVDMRAMSVQQMARQIHADGIDILVDLKGQTFGNRLGVFAYRPAPIQATFLGFPGTSGADFIDYIIGDRHVTPLEHADHYSEKIAQLPGSYQPNDSRRPRLQALTRAQCGLPDDALVMGNFNQSFKLSPETFDAWMRIMKAVPHCILWLLDDNDQAKRNLHRATIQRGVDPERIVFAPRVPVHVHHARLPAADFMLDNWPCNAHTTASDALWMGVPMVTCMGDSFASRVAGSLLHAVGLGELACTSVEQYEATAIALLNDPTRLQRLRCHLEEGRMGFALFDGARFAAGLEALYLRMVERERQGLAPHPLAAQDM
jgi:predicted O-linked N-acetylglucosamine transferase (SPINDLY family)